MANAHLITHWNPEDRAFWRLQGERIARRNLVLSIAALAVAFAVWMMGSAVVVHLPAAGFRFSTHQLFWLAALPALSGATLRFVYAFAVPALGGRRWTVLCTTGLLVPALGMGFALQNPNTSFDVMVLLALLCGLGGGAFASSMAHVSFLYPQAHQGWALGLNAGLGNLGVPLAMLLVPLAIGTGPMPALQNAAFVWVPLILLASAAAWFGMNDLGSANGRFSDQAFIFKRQHTWWMCWLYAGTFGSFIGLAAGLPLLASTLFPRVDMTGALWAGPLVGALVRPLGGLLSDRRGGARVTLWVFVGMTAGALMLLLSLPASAGHAGEPLLFLGGLALLFMAAGLGNGSTFRMVAQIFHPQRHEAAAVLGFASAIAAYGGFFIPKLLGTSIQLTGSPALALAVFTAFYASCIAVTWWHYSRRFAPMPC